MKNYIFELFRPEIEAKMKEERVEEQKILCQTVQRLRKGETVEQLRRSGLDRKHVEVAEQLWLLIKERNQEKVE